MAKIGHFIVRVPENYYGVLSASLATVLRRGCRGLGVEVGTRVTEFIAIIRLEMMVAWAAGKAVRSSWIMDILCRESRGPGGRVKRHINRHIKRKIHKYSGWAPSTLFTDLDYA